VTWSPNSDVSVDIGIPMGGLVFDESGGDRFVFGGYRRETTDSSRRRVGPPYQATYQNVYVSRSNCAARATTCQWTFRGEDYYLAVPQGQPRPDPVWIFWAYSYRSDNGCCWLGTGDFAIKVNFGGPDASRPRAVCNVRPTLGAPGSFDFDATSSEDPVGNGLVYRWDFGDNATSSNFLVTHAYDAPGSYNARLTVTDGNFESDTVDCAPVVVNAPTLGVSIQLLDGATPPLDPDNPVRARLTVSASDDGLGALTDLRFDGAPLHIAPPGMFDITAGPNPVPDPAGFSLDAGEEQSFLFEMQPALLGRYTLTAEVNGVDDLGRAVHAEASSPGEIGTALEVSIALDPASITQEESENGPDPIDITASITVKNNSSGPMRDVNMRSLDYDRAIRP